MNHRLLTSLLTILLCITVRAESLYLNSARGFLSLPVDTIGGRIEAFIDNRSDKPLTYSIPLPDPSTQFSLDIRARHAHAIPDVGYTVTDGSGKKNTVRNPARRLILKCGDTHIIITFRPYALQNILGSSDCVKVDVDMAGHSLASAIWKNHFSVDKNNLAILTRSGSQWNLRYGDGVELNSLSFLSPVLSPTSSVSLQFDPGVAISISSLGIRTDDAPSNPVCYDMDYIRAQLLDSHSFLTGVWQLYDYEFRTEYLSAPEPLRLAICPLEDNYDCYGMFYLSGYPESSPWKEGMLKAIISPSAFPDIYDVAWTDASFATMSHGIQATIQDFPLLTILFSPQNSHMRLRKVQSK